MGGPGSGRRWHHGARPTVESRLRLDVRRLHRAGLLGPGATGVCTWRRAGRVTGSISHRALGGGRAEALLLAYEVDGEPVRLRVPLAWTPCHYGGARPWARCPGCRRRVAILYGGRLFLCRGCHGLAYSSTREGAAERGIRKAQAIRERLGGSPNLALPFPEKPKGMHWRTYHRLRDEAAEAYLGGLQALIATFDRYRFP